MDNYTTLRVHSPEVLAYFEHLRGEKDAIARKAAAEKRKLEAEIVELRRKCTESSSSLEAERDVTRRVKAREADAQLNAEREAAARSQTANQRDEADRQLRSLHEQRERESISMGELQERVAQLSVDVQLERERAERAEDDMRMMHTSAGAEERRGESSAAVKTINAVPLPGASQAGEGPSARSNLPGADGGGVCGGLWNQKRHAREGWSKLLDEAAARIIPRDEAEAAASSRIDDGAGNASRAQQEQEAQPPWIQAVLSGDLGAAAAAARGGGAVTIYLAGANSDTKSERGVILEDIQPYIRRLARAVGLDLSIVDLASGGEGTPLNPRAIDMIRRDVHAGTTDVEFPVGTLGGGMLVLLLGDRYGPTVLPRLLPGDEFEAVVDNMIRHERRNRGEEDADNNQDDKNVVVPSVVFREMYESDALSSGNEEGQSTIPPTTMVLRLKPPSMPSSDLDDGSSETYLKGRASLARWRKGLSLAALAARKAVKRLVVKGKLPLHALERYSAASTEAAAAAAILGKLPGDTSSIETVKNDPADTDSSGLVVDSDEVVKVRSTSAAAAPSAPATWRVDLASAPAVRSVMMIDRTTEGINMTEVAARSHSDVAVDPATGTPKLDSNGAYIADSSAQRSLASLKGALGAFLPKTQRFESNPAWVSDGITVASSGSYLAEMADALCTMLAERVMEGGVIGSQSGLRVGTGSGMSIAEEVARETAAHGAAAAALKAEAKWSPSPEQAAATDRIIRYVRGAEGGGPVGVPLVIRASPGGGASTVLANALAAVRSSSQTAVPLLRIVGLTAASSGVRSLMTSICDQLAVLAGKPAKSPGSAAKLQGAPMLRLHELQPLLFNLLAAAARALAAAGRGPLVLAIDGVHRLSGSRSSRSLAWLPCSLPSDTRVIITLADDPTAAADALRTFPTRMAVALSMSLSATKSLAGPTTEAFTDGGGATTSAGSAAADNDERVSKAMAMSAAAAFMKGGAGIMRNADESKLVPPESEALPPQSPEPAVDDSSNESGDDKSESDRDEDEGESDDEATTLDVPIPFQCMHVLSHSNWKKAARSWTDNAVDDKGKISPVNDVTVKAVDAAIDAFPSCTPARARLAAAAARRGLLNPVEGVGVKRKSVPSSSAVDLINELLKAAEETHGELLTRRALRLLTAAEHGLSLSELGDLMASDDDIIRNLQAVDAGQTFALPQPLLRSLRRHLAGFIVERTGRTGSSDEPELMLAPFQPSLRRAPTLFISLLLYDLSPLLLRLSPSDGAALLSWRSEDAISAARARYLSTVEDQRSAYSELVNYFSATSEADRSGLIRASGAAALRPLRLQAPGGQYHRVVDDSMVDPQPVAHNAGNLKGGCICASGPTRPGLKPDANLNRRKLAELPAAILGLIDTGGVRGTSKAEKAVFDFDLVAGMLATGSGDKLIEVYAAVAEACKRISRDPRSLIELAEFVRTEADFLARHPGSTLQQALNCPLDFVVKAAAKFEVDVASRAAGGMCSQAIMFHWRNKPTIRPSGGLVWRAHKGIIRAIAYSPDGLRLATAGEDGAVTIHDAITCEPESLTKGHESGQKAIAVAWSPSGRRLVSGGDDCHLRVWDPSTGDAVRALDADFPVQSVSFAQMSHTSNTPGYVAAGGLGGRVALWSTRKWLKVGVFRAHDAGPQGYLGVPALSWSAAQKDETDPAAISLPQLATAGDDGIIKVWDVSGIFGGSDKAQTARLARQDFRKALRRLEHAWPAEEWSLGGWRLRDKLQNLFDCEVDELSKIWANIRKQHGLPGDGLDDAAGEATLLAAIKELWDKGISPTSLMAEGREAFSVMVAARSMIPRPQVVARLKAHASQALCVAWSPGGEILASGGADGMVRLWNVRDSTAPPSELDPIDGDLAGARRWVTGVTFGPEGKRIVAVCGDRMAHLWARKNSKGTEPNSVAGGKWVRLGPPRRGHTAGIMAVSFAPDGTMFATADGDGTVMKWGAPAHTAAAADEGDETSSSSTKLSSHRGPITMVAAAPTSSGSAASVGVDGRLCIWQIPQGNGQPSPSPRTTVDVGSILNLEHASSGGSNVGGNSETPADPITVMLHSVSWSANGEYVVVCGEHGREGDGFLRVWCTSASASTSAADKSMKRPTWFFSRSTSVFSRKKNTAAIDEQTTSNAGFDAGSPPDSSHSSDWWEVPPTVLEGQATGQNGAFYCVAFDPTSAMLAAGGATSGQTASKCGASGQVVLWNVDSGGDGWKQMVLFGHGDKNGKNVLPSAVRAMAFGPTGRRIATSGGREGATSVGDNVVRVWDVVQKRVAITLPLEADAGGAVGLDFSPSGRGLAVACANGDVRVYATDGDGKTNADAGGGNDSATLVKFLSGGSAPPRSQGSVLLQFARAHMGGAAGVKFGPNGAYLFSIGLDGCVRAWSVASAAPAAAFPMSASVGGGTMGPLSIAPDGYSVVAGDDSGAPYMLTLEVARLENETDEVE